MEAMLIKPKLRQVYVEMLMLKKVDTKDTRRRKISYLHE
jgi:hypothetical protein